MAKSMATRHKRDIKIFLTGVPGTGNTLVLHGFETYRFDNTSGKMQKILEANAPGLFLPDVVEDGYQVTFVSDTPNNRKVLKELVEARMIMLADDSILEEKKESPKEEEDIPEYIPDGVTTNTSDLAKMQKAELFKMCEDLKITADPSFTKAKLIELIITPRG